MTELKFTIKAEDILAFNNHHHRKHNPQLARGLNRHRYIWPAATLAGAAYVWFWQSDALIASILVATAITWSLVIPAYLHWLQCNQILSDEKGARTSDMLGAYKLRIEDDFLALKLPNGKAKVNWSDVWRTETISEYSFIYITKNSALIIPRSEQRNEEIDSFIEEANQLIEPA